MIFPFSSSFVMGGHLSFSCFPVRSSNSLLQEVAFIGWPTDYFSSFLLFF